MNCNLMCKPNHTAYDIGPRRFHPEVAAQFAARESFYHRPEAVTTSTEDVSWIAWCRVR